MKIAVVTPTSITGETGGAENLYKGLTKKLREKGHEVDWTNVKCLGFMVFLKNKGCKGGEIGAPVGV